MAALAADIWLSLRRMPLWVQVWMMLVLVPVNLAALAFCQAPYGIWVAALAAGGMAPNLFFLIRDRGFSRVMAVSHLVLWPPLVVLILWILVTREGLGADYEGFLCALLTVNLISLGFDLRDGWLWRRFGNTVI